MKDSTIVPKVIEKAAKSKDGTRIGYRVYGKGPGIVLVHGNASSSEDYDATANLLAQNFTVYVMDRRSRGLSGPQGNDYSMQKECEDVIRILQETGSTFLFGHSYGALVSLAVALQHNLDKLILYEPPLLAKHLIEQLLPKFRNMIAKHDYVEAYVTLIDGLGILHSIDITTFKHYLQTQLLPSAAWPRITQLMDATEKEAVEAAKFESNPAIYTRIKSDTLLIGGADSPTFLKQSLHLLEAALPNAQRITLIGQGHTAMMEAPAELATAIRSFCL